MNSLVFLLSALSFAVLASSRGFYQCQPCRGEECNVRPEGCKYGMEKGPCGIWRCNSGPGQRCGGRDNHLGKCGNGTTCNCGICRGCSTDMYEIGIIECSKGFICY
ncbi:unnamed protein product [Nezara viridula]|uniref:Neuropeptide n=1 Tax=Nezara viridula TaxID=85310 RepID=A0A9P0HUI6_NEZVI|nr:unnamed protein product [Nezara viridula]